MDILHSIALIRATLEQLQGVPPTEYNMELLLGVHQELRRIEAYLKNQQEVNVKDG